MACSLYEWLYIGNEHITTVVLFVICKNLWLCSQFSGVATIFSWLWLSKIGTSLYGQYMYYVCTLYDLHGTGYREPALMDQRPLLSGIQWWMKKEWDEVSGWVQRSSGIDIAGWKSIWSVPLTLKVLFRNSCRKKTGTGWLRFAWKTASKTDILLYIVHYATDICIYFYVLVITRQCWRNLLVFRWHRTILVVWKV